ncbi:F-box protein SKIP23-like [Glycine soja]|uniref:F-box protein SKIP23-like n=1 Tax=Glycine soja TaxID=3848 RepID=UPI00103EE01F|nr:F-box protein SKIP23-like [Glycine soja]
MYHFHLTLWCKNLFIHSSMADWSELPKDLLHKISQLLLESPLYLLRFRSVCSSWRSSTPPSPFNPSISLTNTFSLSHRTLLLLNPNPNPNPNPRPWLVKLSLDPHASTARLFHPLSRFPMKLPRFALDLFTLPALDLGREFLLTNTRHTRDSLYIEKLVFLPLTHRKDRFALLTIHVSGKLALFRSGDDGWTVIPDMPTPYDDVCVFKGNLYGADSNGRTVRVRPDDGGLTLAAEPVFGGDKKFLVESEGALLLVDMYLSYYSCTQGLFHEDFDEEDVAGMGWERTVKFDVFRLDEEGKKWVELTDLGERVLFLGDDCAFSASAKDLNLGRGNCVVFRDDGLGFNRVLNGMGVFCLDDGKISPLSECAGFSELFCPPPDWVGLQ